MVSHRTLVSRDAGAFVLCHSGDSLGVRVLLPSIQTHPAAPRHLALLLAADQDHRSPAPPSEAAAVRYSTCSSSSSTTYKCGPCMASLSLSLSMQVQLVGPRKYFVAGVRSIRRLNYAAIPPRATLTAVAVTHVSSPPLPCRPACQTSTAGRCCCLSPICPTATCVARVRSAEDGHLRVLPGPFSDEDVTRIK
jgi:hypothetical protein